MLGGELLWEHKENFKMFAFESHVESHVTNTPPHTRVREESYFMASNADILQRDSEVGTGRITQALGWQGAC